MKQISQIFVAYLETMTLQFAKVFLQCFLMFWLGQTLMSPLEIEMFVVAFLPCR